MNCRIALGFLVMVAGVWPVSAQLEGPHPAGLVTLTQAPSLPSASLSIVDFEATFPGQAVSMRPKAGGLFCTPKLSFCAGPYIECHAMTTIAGEIFVVERNAETQSYVLSKFAGDFSREQIGGGVGFTHIESLVWTGTQLIASSVDRTEGTSHLIEIDPATGVGVRITEEPLEAIIVGMAWDPERLQLHGISVPSEVAVSLPASLYQIDLQSKTASLIGPLGKDLQGLSWIAPFGLVGVWDRVYLINSNSGELIPLVSGPEFRVDEDLGIYCLAANGPLSLPPAEEAMTGQDLPVSVAIEEDQVKLRWEAKPNTFYEVDYAPNLQSWNWQRIESVFVGEEGRQNCGVTVAIPAGESVEYEIEHLFEEAIRQGFYRVRVTEFEATATNDPLRFLIAALLGLAMLGVRRLRLGF